MTQENELRPCLFCGGKLKQSDVEDDVVWCKKQGCILRVKKDLTQNAYCWKIIDQDKQAIKELVKTLDKVLGITTSKSHDTVNKGTHLDSCRHCYGKRVLAKYQGENK